MTRVDEILDIVAQKAMLDRSILTPERKLSDLNISSLDTVEIVFMLEDKFGIELPFNANTATSATDQGFETLGDIIALVEKQLAAKEAGKPAAAAKA